MRDGRDNRDNVKLRHRVEELEDSLEKTIGELERTAKRVNDLEVVVAERIGYDTPFYADQPKAAEAGR